MNKKVLTLCAATLLFGGSLLSNAYAAPFVAKNAQEIAFAGGEKHAIDEGQYFKIHRTAFKNAGSSFGQPTMIIIW